MRIHVRAEPGTRIEDTAARFAALERAVRTELGNGEVQFVASNIGLPDPINIGWVPTAALGSFDGELLIQLASDHQPIADVKTTIRTLVNERFKDLTIFFRPADATGQTLAGLSPTDIDVRFAGRDIPGNAALVQRFQEGAKDIRGVTDLGVQQISNLPEYYVRVDRVRAGQLGLSQSDALNAVLGVLGSGGTIAPSFWADEATGLSYGVQIQSPVADLASAEELMNTAVRASSGGPSILLRTFATIEQRPTAANISRATLQPVTNVQLNVADRDLGGVYAEVEQLVEELRGHLRPANRIEVRGQAAEMASAYAELTRGLLLAVVLVYLIMVINFQSWALPLAALGALPFALIGAWAGLMATGTPLSVPALTGLIMVVGVSSANSVLVASFARDRVAEGISPAEAAIEAARLRLRPVIMTALAMILGMLPMALGLGEAGAQNAPLGRVVIGGLLFGTAASLLAVPALFATLARRSSQKPSPAANQVLPGAAS
jgi:multidrug efflux pump subunit AcrB